MSLIEYILSTTIVIIIISFIYICINKYILNEKSYIEGDAALILVSSLLWPAMFPLYIIGILFIFLYLLIVKFLFLLDRNINV